MKLRFDLADIPDLAEKYWTGVSDSDRRREDDITERIAPAFGERGHLTKAEFLAICAWKTPRSRPRCESNDESDIREVSRFALSTTSERARIQVWTMLSGVSWPTASVFLHFGFPDQYPILDFRALWSMQVDVPSQYTFALWWDYTQKCREIARRARVSMRTLDRALWAYSSENQP